jgi:hypothetical protein
MDEAVFWLLVIGVPSAACLAGWGLSRVPRLVRGWRYDWARAKHLVTETERATAERDFYGSMDFEAEHALYALLLPAPEVAHEDDWLAQTRADLAPEALAANPPPVSSELADDSGPGETPSVDPGPDQHVHDGSCTDDRCSVLGPLTKAQERLADSGDIMDANLAADVAAYQRAQDDQVRAWCSGYVAERQGFTRQLAEIWA